MLEASLELLAEACEDETAWAFKKAFSIALWRLSSSQEDLGWEDPLEFSALVLLGGSLEVPSPGSSARGLLPLERPWREWRELVPSAILNNGRRSKQSVASKVNDDPRPLVTCD